jgi:hypothetical protein
MRYINKEGDDYWTPHWSLRHDSVHRQLLDDQLYTTFVDDHS